MSLLRKIAFPFSWIYALIVHLRNKFFDLGFFASKEFQTPTICVGNLSVGGTGKTPMIEYLIHHFQGNYKIAVLSRGYKRKSKGFVLASSKSTVEDVGDEPYQISSKFPKVAVAVDADRRNGMAQLEKEVKPDIILLDDAFQHRKVKAGFNILLTSYGNLYVDDTYLPTGNLRDAKSQSRRAQYIVVTKCPRTISIQECKAIKKSLAPNDGQKVLFSYLQYDNELKSAQNNLPLKSLENKPFTLITGIANAQPLVEYLKNLNLSFEHSEFSDHHFFSSKEIHEFNSKDILVTTEKDYTRLKGKVKNLFYITISHTFLNEGKEEFGRGISEFMRRNS